LRILAGTAKAVVFRENLIAEKDYFKERAARREAANQRLAGKRRTIAEDASDVGYR
jgi:hypothetical protein